MSRERWVRNKDGRESLFLKKTITKMNLRDHKNMRSTNLKRRVRDEVGFRDF